MTALAKSPRDNSGDGLSDLPLPGVASDLRPALLAGYGDLAALRYDFPLVLVDTETADRSGIRTLTEIVDDTIRVVVPEGRDGDKLHGQILELDAELRLLVAGGKTGRLSELWQTAADSAGVSEVGKQTLSALPLDGNLVECDGDFPAAFMNHVWRQAHGAEKEKFAAMVADLVRRLSDILRADFSKSGEAHSAWNVERAVGPTFGQVFDFDAMSRLLKDAPQHERLSVARKERIGWVISTLQSQRFFDLGEDSDTGEQREKPHTLVFDKCETALRAFHDRLPEMIELIKSVAIARLEIENRYQEDKHNAVLDRLDASSIDADDLALFPSFLVLLGGNISDARENAALFECLASNVPFKILALTEDLFAAPAVAGGSHPCSVQSLPLARMALGLCETFVMQSSVSHFNTMRKGVVAGMENSGPALFSVYAGAAPPDGGSRYLDAAAAVESRTFPVFTFDPAAGNDWAARFSLEGNPQCEADWPAHDFRYEEKSLQRQSQTISFSFADFAAQRQSHAAYFDVIHPEKWREDTPALTDRLVKRDGSAAEPSLYILMVDDDGLLYRVAVAEPIIEATLRCRDAWRSLQEMGGIHSSHVRAALEQEKAAAVTAVPEAREEPAPASAPAIPVADTVDDEEPVDHGPDPYIETGRCTTCNECTEINARMFVYDDNMQASIADPDAGTYRQLVEAAESCQVCIIHPGQPRNPDEPGLDELLERAAEFN